MLELDGLAAQDAGEERGDAGAPRGLEEVGHVLQVSPRTVERDWEAARAWLFRALSGPTSAWRWRGRSKKTTRPLVVPNLTRRWRTQDGSSRR